MTFIGEKKDLDKIEKLKPAVPSLATLHSEPEPEPKRTKIDLATEDDQNESDSHVKEAVWLKFEGNFLTHTDKKKSYWMTS